MFLSLLLASATSVCPIEKAQYQLRGDPMVTASFHPVPRSDDWRTGLALRVHVRKSGRSYWFLPWQGGTDGRINLAWVREKRSPIPYQGVRRDLEFVTADKTYDIDAEIPALGKQAPAHMLIPDLGRLAWHATTNSERDNIARAFFDLSGCIRPDRTEPAPQIEFPPVP